VVVTAQHREMLDQVLRIFKVKPDYDLDVMEEEQSLPQVLSACVQGLSDVLSEEKPDMVLVQGDTTTTFAGAMSAYYHQIMVGHVEAGLRTDDKYRPFPEEINRRLVTHVADVHFPPTKLATKKLKEEGIPPRNIYTTGNTVVDALLEIARQKFDLEKLKIPKEFFRKKIVLVTVHRRESFGGPIRAVCRAIRKLAEENATEIAIVVPAHRNPQARKAVEEVLDDIPNVFITGPMEYLPFVHLLKNTHLVITDSGGIQEEAPTFGKPVLVVREKTERPEGIEAGVVQLVGREEGAIFSAANRLLRSDEAYDKMSRSVNPYGDGKAAPRIVSALLHKFGFTDRRPDDFKGEA
jgi:UDP-N-acetylglucosamine 2-epimerase (non-hydrolysing)